MCQKGIIEPQLRRPPGGCEDCAPPPAPLRERIRVALRLLLATPPRPNLEERDRVRQRRLELGLISPLEAAHERVEDAVQELRFALHASLGSFVHAIRAPCRFWRAWTGQARNLRELERRLRAGEPLVGELRPPAEPPNEEHREGRL